MKLQRDIDRLGCWARKWGVRFQPVKCNMMQLTRKRIKKIHVSYTLEGTDIKHFGVTITNDLRWNTQVSNVCTKANRTLGFLRRNLHAWPQEVKEELTKDWCARSWSMAVRSGTPPPPRCSSSGRIRKRTKARSQIRNRKLQI